MQWFSPLLSARRIVAASRRRRGVGAAALIAAAGAAMVVALVSGPLSSRAVQNPSISIDMITTGNTYTPTADANSDGIPDSGTNHMTLGPIDNCLTTHPPGEDFIHGHSAHLVIQNVEDLVGWSARFNYMGDQLHLVNFGPTPFDDTFTGRLVGFLNLPIDSGTHRGVSTSVSIPPATPGPQTALIGAVYIGSQSLAVSPDTPQKAVHDEPNRTYGTTGGGILADLVLRVEAGNRHQPSLFLNLDDGNPNSPGTEVDVFTGTGIQIPANQLGDGYHGEGSTCVPLNCTVNECPPVTPSPTPSPLPTPGPEGIALDMIPTGNSYAPGVDGNSDGLPDPGTNHMTIGPIDSCLTTAAPGSNVQHFHTAHLVTQNVEDLVGWTARVNYLGDQMRPSSVNIAPFTDTFTFQSVGFTNLPLVGAFGVHRGLTTSANIPPAAPGPQTAHFGGVYAGPYAFAVSPDTPQKVPHDEANQTYGTTGGGVLAAVTLEVRPGNAGQPSLFANLDDGNPNTPGSSVTVFTGSGTTELPFPVNQLGDGFHGEGATCVPQDCTVNECQFSTPGPTDTPTPSPAPTPTPSPFPQNPTVAIDMITTGNGYVPGDDQDADGFPDPGTNHIIVGTVNNCLTTASPGNNLQHNHPVHLVIQNVEDLIAWQIRMNYIGDRMRPSTFNATPFTDSFTGDAVGFANLAIDGSNHRGVIPASSIPAAPPNGTNTPQTALIGAVYGGSQTFAVSPDTPQKAVHDEANQTYGTTGGGILATLTLQVKADLAGNPSLFMNLDDGNPNPPESNVTVFNGSGTTTIPIPPSRLGDGYHGEGATCVPSSIDDDLDGWSDLAETVIGTDPFDACADNAADNAWPADINNDLYSDITDRVVITGNFGKSVPPGPARADVSPDPPNGFVDTADIARLTHLFGQHCPGP